MELNKYQSWADASEKPRNAFSQGVLRFRVGEKRVKGTMSCIRIPSALVNSNLYNKTKSMGNIQKEKHKDYRGSLENIQKIEEDPDEDEKGDTATGTDKVKKFLIADEDSDASSSSGDDGEREEDDRKDAMELVDDDLKRLLLSFDSLERPSADEIKEK